MLLTITTTHVPATDLGYLLHKNPSRLHSDDLSFGKAHVFYPEISSERCTAALLLDVDPVGLVRNRQGPPGEGGLLEQYVNDRPYVASSFMSVAIARMFGTALGGRSKERGELADQDLPFETKITPLMCRGGEGLLRKLRGRNVQITHGLDRTLAEIDRLPEASKQSQINEITEFIDSLISHFVLDEGKLVVAHAGMKQEMQGRGSGKVRDFALYGETTGETDEFGLPVRYNWAAEYRGDAIVVYGHTPVVEPEWLNRTINIDTGCVFGGELTTLRYPERELVSVEAVSFPGNGKQGPCRSEP